MFHVEHLWCWSGPERRHGGRFMVAMGVPPGDGSGGSPRPWPLGVVPVARVEEGLALYVER